MKKSTIWIISLFMGISFLALLYLQTKYIEEVITMSREQFNIAVNRCLYRACRKMELDETQRGLEREIRYDMLAMKTEDAYQGRNIYTPKANSHAHLNDETGARGHESSSGSVDKNPYSETPFSVREAIRLRYIHQQDLLSKIIYDILYESSNKPLAERVDFQSLDRAIKQELRARGIDIAYHFTVSTTDGREVYRCADFDKTGEQYSYKQVLFPNDHPSKMGIITIHFPEMQQYIFRSARFMIPAIIFTIILLLIFIFTIYTIFRQKKLTEIKNDFINNMTHEFKTPISTISLAAQMLNDPAVAKSETMYKHISRVINDETKRLRFQVEKVLQMSMFEHKAGTFKPRELDANSLIADVAATFRLKAETSGGTIDTELNAEIANVYVDEMHFTNVIFNLMDNALKYKKPDESSRILVTTRNEADKLIISVQDNGIGIKKEDLKKIFDRFFRVHTGNRHDVKGFGLGLAYVKKIIMFHKGQIYAESELGKGTTFVIILPIIKQ